MKKHKADKLSCRDSQKLLCIQLAWVLIVTACATIPRNALESDRGDFDLLPENGTVYIWANIHEARPLLESITFDGLSLMQAGQILDRTTSAAAVFFSKEETALQELGLHEQNFHGPGDRFLFSLRGKYPTFGAGFSFTFSRDWKKTKSLTGNSYWFSESYGIGVAMNQETALVSGGDPFSKTASFQKQEPVRVPEGFDDFRQGAIMAGWIPDKEHVNKFLSDLSLPLQIPAEDFFFSIIKEPGNSEDLWQLNFHIRTASAAQARALVTLFSLARMFIGSIPVQGIIEDNDPADISLMDFLPYLFANIPDLDGSKLMLKSAVFSTAELSLLFNAISVYSTYANL